MFGPQLAFPPNVVYLPTQLERPPCLPCPQEAGDAARYTHSGSSQPTGQVMSDGGYTQLEGGVCQSAARNLTARGTPPASP